jgi:hypothetical protein
MAVSDIFAKNGLLVAVIGVLGVYIVLQYDPTLFGLLGRGMEGFEGAGMNTKVNGKMTDNRSAASGSVQSSAGQTTSNKKVAMTPPSVPTAGDRLTKEPFENMKEKKEGFADLASMEGPASFGSAEAPAGCYPRAQLTPVQLLPADQDSIYAQQNPMGVGSLKGKNFLSAGALIGVNTVGQTLRNANLQLRSEPPNPQVSVSIFNQSTIQSDVNRRPLEVGCT